MANPTKWWERLECGSGAAFVTPSAFKSCAWFILLHHTVSVGAVYIFFCVLREILSNFIQ